MNGAQQEKRVLRIKEVEKIVGLKRPTLYLLMNKGDFPQNFRLGNRSVGWNSLEIDRWIEDRLQCR